METITNGDWLQVVSQFVSILVAITVAYYTYKKQKQTTLNLDLSNRYQAWKIERTALTNPTPYQEKELYRLYFNLCAEEYDLCFKRSISKTDKKNLFDGIKEELKDPISARVWKELLSENYYSSKDFKDFINKIIERNEEIKM